jgi:hypothetical protein
MYIAAQQRADQQTQARANDLLIQYIHQHPRAQWDGVIWDLCTYVNSFTNAREGRTDVS